MKKTICLVVIFLAATGSTRADFSISGNESFTVNSSHINGYLYETSQAFIVSGGAVNYLHAYNYSTTNVSSGSVRNYLHAYDYSTTNVSGGSISALKTYNYSTANVSDGFLNYLEAYDSSAANVSGGSLSGLYPRGFSTVNVSGGSVSNMLEAYDSSTVNISGGFIGSNNGSLWACDYSIVNFSGQNFHYGSGLTIDGLRVLGTGILSGEWFDGTPWATTIGRNDPGAMIMVTPEPATLLLLGLGVVIMRKKRCLTG